MSLFSQSLRNLLSLILFDFLGDKLILKCSPVFLKILNDLIYILMKDPRQLSVVLIKI